MNALSLCEILNKIISFLILWKFPIERYLNPGLARSDVIHEMNKSGISLTEELIDLFCWKNGTNVVKGTPLDDIQFIPGFHILSLDCAISQFNSIKDDNRWNPYWFPFMANGGGDFYAVDLSLGNEKQAPVVGFVLGEQEQEIEYQDISSMMQTFLECYQKGIVFRTVDGYLEMDDYEHSIIARKNNPLIKFWQS